jgi:hypothetical protein
MSRERFKQEAALIVLDRVMEAVGSQFATRAKTLKTDTINKALGQFEEQRARVIGAVAEAIAEGVAIAMGPELIPQVDL